MSDAVREQLRQKYFRITAEMLGLKHLIRPVQMNRFITRVLARMQSVSDLLTEALMAGRRMERRKSLGDRLTIRIKYDNDHEEVIKL
jgi:hypothetical protein